MTFDLNMNNHKVINVSDPTLGTDAVNKGYVDNKTDDYLAKKQVV